MSASNYLNATRGLKSWLFTLDHKRIGIMYLAAIFGSLLLGGLFALILRTKLWLGGDFLITPDQYNRMFTLHGAVMIFLFIIPSIPAALGNFLLPIQLGAKDVAFPRLNLLSFYIYVAGALILVAAILQGGIDTGWTFYTPYSSGSASAVTTTTFGAFVLGFSSILTGLNFIVTMHKMRAPGMTWFRMPLLLWSLYATSVIQLLATPVLAITLLLLAFERLLGIGIFDPAMGGDPVLFQHFFWFYSHPAVYIMILPAMGVISELITTHARKRIFGYGAVAFSSIAIAIISFLVWGHHMFVSGQSELAGMIFSFLTFFVAIPTAIKVFSWVATLYGGSIQLNTPMIYALAFLFLFSIGGLTGLFLGSLATDVHLHDTYFVVAHFHYVMMGGTVIAFLGGIHHWWPKIFGRMYNEKLARFIAVVVFFGFNLTFLPQFVLGTQGMPRRYYSYLPRYTELHRLSTMGAMVLGLAFAVMTIYLIYSLVRGKPIDTPPWQGMSLEWSATTPPITENFTTRPVVTAGPYEFPEIEDVQSAHG